MKRDRYFSTKWAIDHCDSFDELMPLLISKTHMLNVFCLFFVPLVCRLTYVISIFGKRVVEQVFFLLFFPNSLQSLVKSIKYHKVNFFLIDACTYIFTFQTILIFSFFIFAIFKRCKQCKLFFGTCDEFRIGMYICVGR